MPGIPLDEIFASANSLRASGAIIEYSLGGALAAIRYTEPFTTYDADIFFIPADTSLTAGIPAIYEQLRSRGHSVDREHTIIRGFPVQWLATGDLTEEAVREAIEIEVDGVVGRVFRVEYLVAIAAKVGRGKDRVRIEQFLQQTEIDRAFLDGILARYQLKLPIL